jgi:hypothetical protein
MTARALTPIHLLTLAGLVLASPAAAIDVWSPLPEAAISPTGDRWIVPESYHTVEADLEDLRAALAGAPLEGPGAWDAAIELTLPLPDGASQRFEVIESPIMAEDLQSRYPEIRTYVGQGLDDRTATVRFDVVPSGFHAMVLSASGTVLIDPYQRGDVTSYVVYDKRSLQRDPSWTCILDATDDEIRAAEETLDQVPRIENGDELRTYRTAIAATGEYTIFHGGTVAEGLAAIVVAMNRVTGIYEREVAVRFELIPDNDLIVYTNPATDPYTNNDGGAMLGQNQANLDATIGNGDYDIGHVFSTGGGGIASLGVVCVTGSKARGVTGLPSPIGDAFYVDYVAHEIGHQYNATHSFNGTAGACSGNRTATTAYEPGSGSTIMAYAGICGAHNIQLYSDDYFQTRSQDLIIIFTNNLAGSTCPVVTATGNTPPVPDATQPVAFDAIPVDTPFTLTGSGTDADDDALTYCWEEFDLGPAGHPDFPVDNAPILRSFLPVTSPSRTFPAWDDIVNNDQTRGEILPSYGRGLRFRLVVRDNRAGGGGTDADLLTFDVDGTSGPFLLTQPNSGETWSSTVMQEVQWDVAGTDNAVVNCQSVDIRLSTDGGYTYPTTLVAGTANDGTEMVTLPAIDVSTARIMVAAADNVFFDISDEDFAITTTVAVGDPGVSALDGRQALKNRPNPANPGTTISFHLAEAGPARVRIYDSVGREVATVADGSRSAGSHSVAWDGRDAEGRLVAAGIYFYRLETDRGSTQRKVAVTR